MLIKFLPFFFLTISFCQQKSINRRASEGGGSIKDPPKEEKQSFLKADFFVNTRSLIVRTFETSPQLEEQAKTKPACSESAGDLFDQNLAVKSPLRNKFSVKQLISTGFAQGVSAEVADGFYRLDFQLLQKDNATWDLYLKEDGKSDLQKSLTRPSFFKSVQWGNSADNSVFSLEAASGNAPVSVIGMKSTDQPKISWSVQESADSSPQTKIVLDCGSPKTFCPKTAGMFEVDALAFKKVIDDSAKSNCQVFVVLQSSKYMQDHRVWLTSYDVRMFKIFNLEGNS